MSSAVDDDEAARARMFVLMGWSNMKNLCEGGMGAAYRVTGRDGTYRVIKVNKRDREGDPAQELVEEGETLRGLRHPNIAQLYDMTMTKSGVAILNMEYCPGGDLFRRRLVCLDLGT